MKLPSFFKKPGKGKAVATIQLKVDSERDFRNYVKYLSHPVHIMWRNFLAGTFHGVGFILGTALFLTILGYIVNTVMGELPFFSDFGKALNLWLQSTLDNS